VYNRNIFNTTITSLAWSEESDLLAVTGREQSVSILIPSTGLSRRSLDALTGLITAGDWQPKGGANHLVTGLADGKVYIYPNGKITQNTWSLEELIGKGEITAVEWGKDDHNNLAAGTQDGNIASWFAVSRSWTILNFQLQADSGSIHAIDWNPNQSQLLTVGENEGIQVWNPASGGRLMKIDFDSRSAAWSPDGRYIALEDHSLSLTPAGVPVLVVIRSGVVNAQVELPSEVNQVAWSPDGKLIATAGQDGVLRLWRWESENGVFGAVEPIYEFQQDAEITAIVWSPNGNQIITGDLNGSIWMWDVP
jgi:WD40 repeat protein